MEEPIAEFVAVKLDHRRGHGGHVDRVFERGVVPLTIEHSEKMAVQMHGMVHHGAVDHDKAGTSPSRIRITSLSDSVLLFKNHT